jgi:hypothetical protein
LKTFCITHNSFEQRYREALQSAHELEAAVKLATLIAGAAAAGTASSAGRMLVGRRAARAAYNYIISVPHWT